VLESRNPKSEARNPKQIQSRNIKGLKQSPWDDRFVVFPLAVF